MNNPGGTRLCLIPQENPKRDESYANEQEVT